MAIKIFKLKKKDLKSVVALHLSIKEQNNNIQVHPEDMFLSKKDYKQLTLNTGKALKAQVKYRLSKRMLDTSVGMEMLNLGPSGILEDVIKPGYLVAIVAD